MPTLARRRGRLADDLRWQAQGAQAAMSYHASVHAVLPCRPTHLLCAQIIDVIDCTGSGDIDVSSSVEAADGVVKGVYGNELRLNPEWTNPTGRVFPQNIACRQPCMQQSSLTCMSSVDSAELAPTASLLWPRDKLHSPWVLRAGKWHVGAKRAFELFPGPLKKRVTKERRKPWDRQQQATIARILNDTQGTDKKASLQGCRLTLLNPAARLLSLHCASFGVAVEQVQLC